MVARSPLAESIAVAQERVRPQARPVEFDEVAPYIPIKDGESLWMVLYRHPKLQGKRLTRIICKFLAWYDEDFKTPKPYDISALVTDEHVASDLCVDANYQYMPVPVNRVFPVKPVRWHIFNPRAWCDWNVAPQEEVIYRPVDERLLRDLNEQVESLVRDARESVHAR